MIKLIGIFLALIFAVIIFGILKAMLFKGNFKESYQAGLEWNGKVIGGGKWMFAKDDSILFVLTILEADNFKGPHNVFLNGEMVGETQPQALGESDKNMMWDFRRDTTKGHVRLVVSEGDELKVANGLNSITAKFVRR